MILPALAAAQALTVSFASFCRTQPVAADEQYKFDPGKYPPVCARPVTGTGMSRPKRTPAAATARAAGRPAPSPTPARIGTLCDRVPNSPTPGVVWPAMPGPPGSLQLAIQYQMEQTQWWEPERLRQYQFRQLRALLDFAARAVPWYRERLFDFSGGRRPVDAESWQSIPLLTRAEIQTAGDALYAKTLPPGHAPVAEVKTSGSTGRPITVKGTRVSGGFFLSQNLRNHLWHRRDLGAKFCAIRFMKPGRGMPPDGLRGKSWVPAFPSGPLATLNVFSALDDQIDWLLREDPAYLLTYPSNIDALAQRIAERDVRLPSLRDVGTFGEAINDDIRARVTSLLNVPVIDIYSAMEIGVMALQCPHQPSHYHIQSEYVVLEVLDEGGLPCAPGETGRVVVTPLHNYAMPLVRYVIGDYAEVGPPCDCGRGLPVLRRILGRTRNMLVLPNGERRWPGIKFSDLAEVVPLRQIQFVQRTPTEIDIKLVVSEPVAPDAERRLRETATRMLGAEFVLNILYVEHIPRSSGGKYEDFKSEIA
jgi:phenylacetate-CoA ligase